MSTTKKRSKPSHKRVMGKPRKDVYQAITDRIVAQLEGGIRPWLKPWNAEHAAGRITRPLRHGGEPYSGINVLMLWSSAEEQGFSAPLWLTFKQAQQLGGTVKKGEKGPAVVYASTFRKLEEDDQGQEVERDIPFLKQYSVFNAEQCEGLPKRFYELKKEPLERVEKLAVVDEFVKATHAEIHEGGNQACYVISQDRIRMPRVEAFSDAESHAATLVHELTHWTRHSSRLNRDLGRKRWGDAGYAMEELVAELGAAFMCADLGITPEMREDHASYISSWLDVLKHDKRAIFTAASLASQAVDFLHSLQAGESAT